MNRLLFLLIYSTMLVGCSITRPGIGMKSGQSAHFFTPKNGKKVIRRYLLYLPEGYGEKNQSWPLMLFLHGAGERGDDLQLVKTHGPPRIVENRQGFPFILVSPQCSEGGWWTDEEQLEFLEALLKTILAEYRIDIHRIYLTGLSMGGYGTWSLALRNPQLFAAIAPICGGGDPGQVCRIKKVPVWVFHGARDAVVPVAEAEKMVQALKVCGGNVRFTVYPEAGHDAWTKTYNNPELYQWFLQHRKSLR